MMVYPGQNPNDGSYLTYPAALAAARAAAARIKPQWVVARSFGCCIVAALAAEGDDWVSSCRGVVLWGPVRAEGMRPRLFDSREAMLVKIDQLAAQECTRVRPEFFDVEAYPQPDSLVPQVPCPLRLARGSLDEMSVASVVVILAADHAVAQSYGYREA